MQKFIALALLIQYLSLTNPGALWLPTQLFNTKKAQAGES